MGDPPSGQITGTTFCMIPTWVMFADISSRAKLLFGLLQSRLTGRDGGEAFPSRNTLASELGVASADTVDRAVKELEAVGALTKHARFRDNGSHTSNLYELHFDQPQKSGQVAAPTRPGGRKNTATPPQTCGPQNKNHSSRPKEQKPIKPAKQTGFFDSDPKAAQHHTGFRERLVTQILNNAPTPEGKELTPRERKQLRQQVGEWLVAGYNADAISAAITASPYKTPNAVGGELRKAEAPAVPKSWNNLHGMYEQALREEEQ